MRNQSTRTEERSGRRDKSAPEMDFQSGRVRGAIWTNTSRKGGIYYRLDISRVETNGYDTWLSKSFLPEDLQDVMAVSTACRRWLRKNTDAFKARGWWDAKRGRAPRNQRWDSGWKPRKHSFRWMLTDFLIRLVAFSIASFIALAWLKFHYMDGMFSFSN